jgi:hypothetical protein
MNQWIAAELSHPLKKIEMGLPKNFFEKIISFPKKCVEVWVFDGIVQEINYGIIRKFFILNWYSNKFSEREKNITRY